MLLHQQSISLLYLLNKKKRETVTGKKKYRRKPILYQIRKRKEKEKRHNSKYPMLPECQKPPSKPAPQWLSPETSLPGR
jgi:hypothetical protein